MKIGDLVKDYKQALGIVTGVFLHEVDGEKHMKVTWLTGRNDDYRALWYVGEIDIVSVDYLETKEIQTVETL